MGMIPFEPGEADPRDPLVDARAGGCRLDSAEQEGKTDVLVDGLPGKEGVPLENEAEPRVDAADGLAVHGDPTGGRGDEPPDETEQGGFTATGGPHDRHELAASDVERHVLDRGELPLLARQGKPLRHLLEDDGTCLLVADQVFP